MGTEPSRGSVEDRGTDPAGPLVLAVVDRPERVEDLLVRAVRLGVLDDLVLARRVVHAAEGLLDVNGAGHARHLPGRAGRMRGYRRSRGRRSTGRADRRPAGRPHTAEGGGGA